MPRARADLAALVACRSVFDASIEPPQECAAAVALVAELLRESGLSVEERVTPDGSVAVVGRVIRSGGAERAIARAVDAEPGSCASGAARASRGGDSEGVRVLLYAHHDVVPVGDQAAWSSDPWTLTDRDGRWFGRGAADCKGNLVAILTALGAVREVLGEWPVDVTVLVEGSEEQTAGGMERLAREEPDLVAADVIVMADTGNIALGQPTLTTSLRGTGSVRITVRTMAHAAHSGMYGGAAPDALQALITTLASLRSASGETTIDGLDASASWPGAAYDPERFRADAALLAGVDPLGDSVTDDPPVPGADAARLGGVEALGDPATDDPPVHGADAARLVGAESLWDPATDDPPVHGADAARLVGVGPLGDSATDDPPAHLAAADAGGVSPVGTSSSGGVSPVGTSSRGGVVGTSSNGGVANSPRGSVVGNSPKASMEGSPPSSSAVGTSRSGSAIGDLLWARPAATVLAIDAPSTARVTAAVQGEASAIVNLRVPASMDPAGAQRLLIDHLRAHTPYGLVEVTPLTLGRGFEARTDGTAYGVMREAMREAFGVEAVTTGQGGSIPLTVALQELHPAAEILLLGVEEPASRIHATDESVDPGELERTALTLALFLSGLGAAR